MRESSAPAHAGGASGSRKDLQESTARAAADSTAVAPAALLKALTLAVGDELGSLRQGVTPLLDEVGQGLSALFPEPGGERLPPKQQEAGREKLAGQLDELEDMLEALQLAVGPRGQAGSAGSRGGS
jgi:hypothetical protein